MSALILPFNQPPATPQSLQIVTYNIHKGFSQFNQHMRVHELREQLRALNTDIVFLQEVQGLHKRHAERIDQWPAAAQHDFLAEGVWPSAAYAHNVIYDHGHHGNAILARFPIASTYNQDVTQLRFERRGILHCAIEVPAFAKALHCVCVHLSLFARSRRKQMASLVAYLEDIAEPDAPLIIAGDFNDWRNQADELLAQRLNLHEALGGEGGHQNPPGRSYPATHPMLRLDRIYVRGFSVQHAQIHSGAPWSKISDHAALSAHLQYI